MSPFLSRTTIAAACAIAISTSAAAQAPALSDHSAAEANAAARTAPTIMAMPAVDVALRSAAQDVAFSASMQDVALRPAASAVAPVVRRREAFSRPMVLMIVGGALIVTGLVVGSDAAPIMYLAGAGIGGYGLYLYLQSPDARMTR